MRPAQVVAAAAGGVCLAAAYYDRLQMASRLAAARRANASLNLTGKHALVVGGTSGIGEGIAQRLAEAGASVTIAGRSAERGAAIVARLEGASPGGHAFEALDCFSVAACDGLARRYAATKRPIDVLVMSQGMATIQGHTPTVEGLDQKLALHYYSRVALATGLAPALEASPDGRVLSVLSAGVHGSYRGYDRDPELLRSYSIKNAADAAGFYGDVALDKLAKDAHPTVLFLHGAPGFVATSWGTEMPAWIRVAVRGLQRLAGRSKEDCAEFMVKGLFEAALEPGRGVHLFDQYGDRGPTTTPLHDAAAATVWAHTEAVLARVRSRPAPSGEPSPPPT